MNKNNNILSIANILLALAYLAIKLYDKNKNVLTPDIAFYLSSILVVPIIIYNKEKIIHDIKLLTPKYVFLSLLPGIYIYQSWEGQV